MEQHRDAGARCRVTALGVASILLVFATPGCDNSVNVGGPIVIPPTAPPVVGPTVTEVRAIAGVDSVTLRAVGLVDIDFGAEESLTISAPDSVMPLLTSEVVDGTLILARDSSSFQGEVSDIRYEIALLEIDRLALRGVGELTADGVETDRFVAEVQGVGDMSVSGKVDRQILRMDGVGAYLSPDLESRVAEVDAECVGRAEIWATERIVGTVGAMCPLDYWGNPVVAVTGAGEVRRLGPKP